MVIRQICINVIELMYFSVFMCNGNLIMFYPIWVSYENFLGGILRKNRRLKASGHQTAHKIMPVD